MDEAGQDPAPAASPKTAGWILLVIGVLIMLLAADVIPQDSMPPNVPSPVLFVVGLVLASAALGVLVGLGTPVSQVLIGLSMFLMAFSFSWVAVAGDTEQMSGGIPFLPDWLNVYLGRIAFGAFAIVFFGIGVAAWLSAARLREDSGS